MYRKYHYLNTSLNAASRCFEMTINGKPVAFMAVINFPHPVKCYRKVHRLVVLPDYQGLGLGRVFLNFIGNYINFAFAITTSQPALITSLKKDSHWVCTANTKNSRNKVKSEFSKKTGFFNSSACKRITTTFVYKK
jgi:GNAT superfamily N-acetyltransferase